MSDHDERDPNLPPENGDDDADFNLDWLANYENIQSDIDDAHTGVTGELSWRQEYQDNQPQASSGGWEPDASGFGGDDDEEDDGIPDWIQDLDDDFGQSTPEWLNDDEDDEPEEPEPEEEPLELDAWLTQIDEEADYVDSPEWMQEADLPENDGDDPADAGLPEWMRDPDADDLGESDREPDPAIRRLHGELEEEDEEESVPDWLLENGDFEEIEEDSGSEDLDDEYFLPDEPEEEPIPHWIAEEESEIEFEPEAEEDPDWLLDTGSFSEVEVPEETSDVPAWLSNTGEFDDEEPETLPEMDWTQPAAGEDWGNEGDTDLDALDWQLEPDDEEIEDEEPVAAELPDWFSEIGQSEPEPETEPDPDMVVEDFDELFADLNAGGEDEQEAFDLGDLIGEVEFEPEGEAEPDVVAEDFDSLFADLEVSAEGEEETFEPGNLIGESEFEPEGEAEPDAVAADLDSLFADLEASAEGEEETFDLDELEQEETEEPEYAEIGDDFLASFDFQAEGADQETSPDWFGEEDESGSPDWLEDVSPEVMPQPQAVDDLLSDLDSVEDEDLADLLAELESDEGDFDLDQLGEVPEEVPDEVDLDELLASFDTNLDEDFSLEPDNVQDFDELLREQIAAAPLEPEEEALPPNPELAWLRDAAAAHDDEASAAALIRQQKDRPLDDLPDRLQRLHDQGLDLVGETDSALLRTGAGSLLPTPEQSLAPAQLARAGAPVLRSALDLDEDQEKSAALLAAMVAGTPAAARLAAASTDTPEEDELPTPAPGLRLRWRLDRVLLSLILLIIVLLPFVADTGIGSEPPADFAAGSAGAIAFEQIDSLEQGDWVLFAADYGPSAAGELDPVTEALLAHIMLRGGRPVIVSADPVGLVRAERIATDIVGPALRNRAYFPVRYLPGGSIGLRDLVTNTGPLLSYDSQGRPNGLRLESLDRFTALVIVTDRADALRLWMEQVVPNFNNALVLASSYAAQPFSEAYVSGGTANAGLLVGFADSITYSRMLQSVPPATPFVATLVPREELPQPPRPTATPTERPALVPRATQADTGDATEEVVAETPVETAEIVPSATPLDPTPTLETLGNDEVTEVPATEETQPEAAPTEAPTTAPTEIPTETETAVTERFAVIITELPVRVRAGPSTDFDVLTGLQPGTRVSILDENEAGDWLQIQLPDGRTGWIAASLARIEEGSAMSVPVRVAMHRFQATRPQRQPQPTAQPAPAEQLPTIVPPEIPYAGARWDAMTLGIVAAVVVIVLGNVFAILRALLRRR